MKLQDYYYNYIILLNSILIYSHISYRPSEMIHNAMTMTECNIMVKPRDSVTITDIITDIFD